MLYYPFMLTAPLGSTSQLSFIHSFQAFSRSSSQRKKAKLQTQTKKREKKLIIMKYHNCTGMPVNVE